MSRTTFTTFHHYFIEKHSAIKSGFVKLKKTMPGQEVVKLKPRPMTTPT